MKTLTNDTKNLTIEEAEELLKFQGTISYNNTGYNKTIIASTIDIILKKLQNERSKNETNNI